MNEPMKLTAPLKDYLWGGTRLRDEYGKRTELSKVAESSPVTVTERALLPAARRQGRRSRRG